jgi:hypothetical protein
MHFLNRAFCSWYIEVLVQGHKIQGHRVCRFTVPVRNVSRFGLKFFSIPFCKRISIIVQGLWC